MNCVELLPCVMLVTIVDRTFVNIHSKFCRLLVFVVVIILRLQVQSKLLCDLLVSVIDFNIVEVCVCEPSVHCQFALCILASSFDIQAFIGQVWLVIVVCRL